MAVITINMGGRPMAVDVPDFAMESTQQDVRSAIESLTSQIQALKASNQAIDQGEQAIVRAVKDLDSDDKFRKQTNAMGNAVASGYKKAMQAAPSMVKGAGDPGMMANMFKAIGVGTLATQLGMAAGAAQELSKVMQFGGSVGLSFGGNIKETAYELQNIGLRLDQFGDIVGTNLSAMYELGGSVEDGSQAFIDIVKDFRKAAEPMGFFGMASDEMAQFLAEELELRRRTMDSQELQRYAQEELTEAMNKNFIEQEKMARLTGQNVRDRIRAQMEARQDERRQIAEMSMTEDQRRAMKAVFAGLSVLPDNLQKTLTDSVTMGLFTPGGEALTKGFQMGQRSPELMAIIQEALRLGKSGADDTTISNRITDLARDFKQNTDFQQLGRIGFLGDDELSKQIVSGALEMNEIQKTANEGRKILDSEEHKQREAYINAMRGYNAKLDEFYAASLNRVMDFTFAMTGNDADDFVKSMNNLVSGMTNMMTSDYAKGAAVAFGTAFGEMAFVPFMKVFGLQEGQEADILDQAKVLGMIGGGAGFIPADLARLLEGPQNIRAFARGTDAGLRTMFPEFVKQRTVGGHRGLDGNTEEYFDYAAFGEHMRTVAVSSLPEGFQSIMRSIKDALPGNT